ncbi:MAG: TIGR03435 family protein [Bryobacteraceae bacterium]
MRIVIAPLILFLGAARLDAQQTPSAMAPSFDVASLKPVQLTPGPYRANLGTARHGKVVLKNVTLSDCLRFAYGITNDAQIVGPDWIRDRDVRFDIMGKAAPDTPRERLLLMLQTLLIDRFKTRRHYAGCQNVVSRCGREGSLYIALMACNHRICG